MTMNSKLNVSLTATLIEALDLGERTAGITKKFSATLASGFAVGQADRIFQDSRNLAPSATENLDLAGVLTDPFGALLTFVKIKGIYVAAVPLVTTPPTAPNINDVIVGAAAATPWSALLGATGTVTLKPGSCFAAFAGEADNVGWAVGAGATDLLKIANSAGGTSVNYEIIVIGTSA